MLFDVDDYIATCPRCKKPDMILEVCGDLSDGTFLCKFFCLECGFETPANVISRKISIDDLRKKFEIPFCPTNNRKNKIKIINSGVYIGHTLFKPISIKETKNEETIF